MVMVVVIMPMVVMAVTVVLVVVRMNHWAILHAHGFCGKRRNVRPRA